MPTSSKTHISRNVAVLMVLVPVVLGIVAVVLTGSMPVGIVTAVVAAFAAAYVVSRKPNRGR